VSAVFVTGTGTDIGKTFVAAGVIRHLRQSGRSVAALKPVASGFDASNAQASDAAVLLAALGRPATMEEIERISPWRFRAPLSPDLAAKREGRAIDFSALLELSRRKIAQAPDVLLIEGVGGVMVPLDATHTVLDWMALLAIPVLLVTGSYLGTISHTLTALGILAARAVPVAAVVVSESMDSAVPLADTAASIARFATPIDVITLPRLLPGITDHPAFAEIARAI
jgi:dethiobiotin synthetase